MINFKNDMYFDDIIDDFLVQFRNYLKASKYKLDVDYDNIVGILEIPRIALNFMLHGFGVDKKGNATFINYIVNKYCYVYTSNTHIVNILRTDGVSIDQKIKHFNSLFDSMRKCNSVKYLRDTDIIPRLVYEKTGIQLNENKALNTVFMIADFINAYMADRKIKNLYMNSYNKQPKKPLIDSGSERIPILIVDDEEDINDNFNFEPEQYVYDYKYVLVEENTIIL